MAPSNKTQKKGKLGLEVGDSGTEILQGIITEEYNTKLRDVIGVKVYDEMRSSDGTVSAAIQAVSLPIRRAKWFVEAASDDAQDEVIRDFVEMALFDWMTITWNDFLRQALLMLPFGVMPFEKVFEIRNHEGKDYITWRKFAPRSPKTIQKWAMDNGEDGIQQRKQNGDLVDIPLDKMVVFVNDKEGDNWWGKSVLRPAYKHWFIKNTFYKIDAIAFERQGLGVPFCKLPENATEADRTKARDILQSMRANHQAYVIMPFDYEIGFLDMMAKSTRDPEKSIMHHNREIAKSVLAMFLELGATSSGSRALSEDQTELFLLSLGAIAGNVADVINKYAIKQLVDLNFDNVSEYPELKWTGIDRVDAEKLATAYNTFSQAGGIKADLQTDEQFIRETLGLPEREYVEGDDEPVEEPVDPKAPVDPKKKEKPTKEEEETAGMHDGHNHSKKKVNLADYKPRNVKFNRELTLAEEKVNFQRLQDELDRLETQFMEQAQEALEVERAKYISKVNKAIEAGNLAKVKELQVEASKAYEKIIYSHMKESYELGKNNIAKEMGVAAPANDKAILDQIALQSSAIAEQHVAELTGTSKVKITEALNKGQSNVQAVAIADAAIAKLIIELARNTSQIIMAGYVNTGRYTVIDLQSKKIYALQRSEILDSVTCNYCLSLDGRVVEKTDPFARNSIFHSGCRGIWVAIMLDEAELPKIGGIPKGLRDRFGDAVNDLIQPKTPQPKSKLAKKQTEKNDNKKK